jgi:competence protein ComEA
MASTRVERWSFALALAAAALLVGVGAWGRWGVKPLALAREQPDLVAHISGAVNAPGAYRFAWGARTADLIDAAGGLTPMADPSLVAWAMPLTDGVSLVVPQRVTAAGVPRVNINSASIEELQTLPGVGPVMAERIMRARPFHQLRDLERVPGIGPARLSRLEPLVTLGGGM